MNKKKTIIIFYGDIHSQYLKKSEISAECQIQLLLMAEKSWDTAHTTMSILVDPRPLLIKPITGRTLGRLFGHDHDIVDCLYL